jgi:hypothetical protein
MIVASTTAEADTVARRVADRFAPHATEMSLRAAKSYYKVPGEQDVGMSFAFDEERTSFETLLAVLSAGWVPATGQCAIWNPAVLLGGHPLAPFVEPAVTWACMKYDQPPTNP